MLIDIKQDLAIGTYRSFKLGIPLVQPLEPDSNLQQNRCVNKEDKL